MNCNFLNENETSEQGLDYKLAIEICQYEFENDKKLADTLFSLKMIYAETLFGNQRFSEGVEQLQQIVRGLRRIPPLSKLQILIGDESRLTKETLVSYLLGWVGTFTYLRLTTIFYF